MDTVYCGALNAYFDVVIIDGEYVCTGCNATESDSPLGSHSVYYD